MLRTAGTCATTGLGAPILGITWHYIDSNWNRKSVPNTTLHTGAASKSGEKVRSIVEKFLDNNDIIGSENISIHTITSEDEPSMALGVDLLTN